MSKAEDYIKENIKNNTNISISYNTGEGISSHSQPWLTPDQARKAVEIAREEVIDKVIEWIEENIGEYCDGENIMFSATHIENIDVFEQEIFINDLKQAMKDE